jgi:dienelactone hydrolase
MITRHKSTALILLALSIPALSAAEIVRYPGTPNAVPHDKFVHVVGEADSPVQPTYIKSKDGLYVATAIRKPKGNGPVPAIIVFHGAPGGRGLDQLIGWSRGDHGGPVWERFLQEGFVVVVADYRGGDMNSVSSPASDKVTAIDDGLAVIEHAKQLAYVDPARISLYGVSLGGNLVLFLAAKVPTLRSVVAGAPAPIWFLGHTLPPNGPRPDFAKLPLDEAVVKANIAPIETPILIQVGTADRLQELDQVLHDQLVKHGKKVRMEVYEHGYHDFVLGPQGQQRRDMPQGEYLMQGTLDALERSVKFVKTGI